MPKKRHYKRPKRPDRSEEQKTDKQDGREDPGPTPSAGGKPDGDPTASANGAPSGRSAAQYPPVKWYEVATFGSPYTAGGDIDLPGRLPVDGRVLDQSDKSLNKRLWTLYPANAGRDAVAAQGQALHACVSDPIHPERLAPDVLSARLGWHAADQRMQLLFLANVTLKELERFGVRDCPAETRRESRHFAELDACVAAELVEDKRHHAVSPVAEAVAALAAGKAELAGAKDLNSQPGVPDTVRLLLLGATLRGYMRCLLQLAPWHPYPDVLTAEQAFASGAAEVHAALLYNCALLCFRIGTHDCRIWLRALQFATLLVETRFISHRLLIKAVALYRDVHYAMTQRDHTSHLGLRRPPKPHLDDIRRLIQRMENKAVDPEAWAHRHCLTAAHEGCM